MLVPTRSVRSLINSTAMTPQRSENALRMRMRALRMGMRALRTGMRALRTGIRALRMGMRALRTRSEVLETLELPGYVTTHQQASSDSGSPSTCTQSSNQVGIYTILNQVFSWTEKQYQT